MAEELEHNPKKEENALRSVEKILYVHDVVDQFLSGMLPLKPDVGEAPLWTGIQMALCWVLQHSFGINLSVNIEKVVQMCVQNGYIFYAQPEQGGNGRGPKPIIPGSIIKK